MCMTRMNLSRTARRSASRRSARSRSSGPRHRRLGTTSRRPSKSRPCAFDRRIPTAVPHEARGRRPAPGVFTSVLSASSARTSATSSATTRTRSGPSPGLASSSRSRASTCTRSTPATARRSIRDQAGVGLCNITKCCTEVCPEHIHITDNGIIPLKERMADGFDPIVVASCENSGGNRPAGSGVTALRDREVRACRSHAAPDSGHPGSKPTSRPPLP